MTAVGLEVTAGSVAISSALVNASGGAAYIASGGIMNIVDRIQGKEP